jgi:predicted alpha/beta hydrolase
MPLLARVFGYFPGSRLKLGDDLPQRFALQWAGRRTPEFHLDADANAAARQQRMLDAARALTVPGLAVTFFDDAFVGENGVRRFLFAIPSAPVVRAEIEPTATGGERIGHFGFFRRRFAGLWDIVTRFLHTHVAG